MTLAQKPMPKMDCWPISEAPKDGTRILAWPCEWDYARVGSRWTSVKGWGVVAWDHTYEAWNYSPSEAEESDPRDQHPKWWMPLPATPYGESE